MSAGDEEILGLSNDLIASTSRLINTRPRFDVPEGVPYERHPGQCWRHLIASHAGILAVGTRKQFATVHEGRAAVVTTSSSSWVS
jgi:hypothetical protein